MTNDVEIVIFFLSMLCVMFFLQPLLSFRSVRVEFLHDADPADLAQRQRHGLAALLQETQLVSSQQTVFIIKIILHLVF